MKTVADLWPGDRVIVDKSCLLGHNPYLCHKGNDAYEVTVVNIDPSSYAPEFAVLLLVDARDEQFTTQVRWDDLLES